MRNTAISSIRRRPQAADAITAADIEAWVRVERALSGRDEACRRLAAALRAASH